MTFDFASFIFGVLVGAVGVVTLIVIGLGMARWLLEHSSASD